MKIPARGMARPSFAFVTRNPRERPNWPTIGANAVWFSSAQVFRTALDGPG